MRRLIATLILFAVVTAAPAADGATVIDSMDEATYKPLQKQEEKVKIEQVEGHEGKALKFSFTDKCSGAFAQGRMRGSADWDKAAGFSFWVKGDGSKHLGGLQFVWNDDFSLRYTYAFPIDGTEWKKVTVAWRDLIPALPGEKNLPLDPAKGNAPSKLGNLWVGKWFFWKDYAACSYSLDQFQLEPTIVLDTQEYLPEGAPLARVKAKLAAHKPITIVTMGDSLTDPDHWANKETRWADMLKAEIKKKYGSEVTIVNPAVGGSQLKHGLIIMPQWLAQAPEPDLVTIFYGFNDDDGGMTGPLFKTGMADAIDRVRRATKGKADVLVLSTCPAGGKWDKLADLAEACRTAARDRKAGLSDIYKVFHAAGADEAARDKLYVSDHTHLALDGHTLVTKTVLESIDQEGK